MGTILSVCTMPAFILVPFLAFACCVLGQIYLATQIEAILTKRYPDIWRNVRANSLYSSGAVQKFVRGKMDKPLGDIKLSQLATDLRRVQLAGWAIWLVYVAAIFGGLALNALGSAYPS